MTERYCRNIGGKKGALLGYLSSATIAAVIGIHVGQIDHVEYQDPGGIQQYYTGQNSGQEELELNWFKSPPFSGKSEVEKIIRVKNWYREMVPQRISIPNIHFESEILVAGEIPGLGGLRTYQTPDSGIATPEDLIENNILVFGHSRWQGEMQIMSKIQYLELGDEIKIEAEGLASDFVVTEIRLVDYIDPAFRLDGWEKQSLTLQTTASTSDGWILDKELVLSKLTSGPNLISGHSAFLVIASPKIE